MNDQKPLDASTELMMVRMIFRDSSNGIATFLHGPCAGIFLQKYRSVRSGKPGNRYGVAHFLFHLVGGIQGRPGVVPHDTVHLQPYGLLEGLHTRHGVFAEDAVHASAVKADGVQLRLEELDFLALAAIYIAKNSYLIPIRKRREDE